jgi:hypothetical protein
MTSPNIETIGKNETEEAYYFSGQRSYFMVIFHVLGISCRQDRTTGINPIKKFFFTKINGCVIPRWLFKHLLAQKAC